MERRAFLSARSMEVGALTPLAHIMITRLLPADDIAIYYSASSRFALFTARHGTFSLAQAICLDGFDGYIVRIYHDHRGDDHYEACDTQTFLHQFSGSLS